MQTIPEIERLVETVEQLSAADPVAERLEPVAAALARGQLGGVLRGDWLGHAFHPLLTDFPLGCWLASGLLDLVGGRRGRPAAQRLVGIGLLMVPITATTGAADWSTLEDPRVRRVGVVHAIGNVVVGGAYFQSWRARRAGHHVRGVAWGLTGGALAFVTGYLGGHLSFGRGASVGARGMEPVERPASEPAFAQAAY